MVGRKWFETAAGRVLGAAVEGAAGPHLRATCKWKEVLRSQTPVAAVGLRGGLRGATWAPQGPRPLALPLATRSAGCKDSAIRPRELPPRRPSQPKAETPPPRHRRPTEVLRAQPRFPQMAGHRAGGVSAQPHSGLPGGADSVLHREDADRHPWGLLRG